MCNSSASFLVPWRAAAKPKLNGCINVNQFNKRVDNTKGK